MGHKLTDFSDKAARRILAAMQAEDAGRQLLIQTTVPAQKPIQNETNLPPDNSIPDAKPCKRKKALETGSEGKAPRPGLRHCRFTLRRLKLLDVDAKYASIKNVLDCLTIAGIIRGDREGEITLEVIQEKVTKGDVETTVIEVFE